MDSGFGQALYYVAADYQPCWPRSPGPDDRSNAAGASMSSIGPGTRSRIERVRTAGLAAFRNVSGCILSNELIDNFPVHRFAIRGGRLKEVFVTLAGDDFAEVLSEPSSPRIGERLAGLGLSLDEGWRGEVNLAIEDWIREISAALDRGFVLTIDYGAEAAALYSAANSEGTLACFHRHAIANDPYRHVGEQDITCHVDFTSLMRLGERHGLATVGYTAQREFLANLGFSSLLDAPETQGLSAARTQLNRIAMMSLVDPDQYGGLKVLAQAKGIGAGIELLGFAKRQQ